jgi:hypothetical protein
MKMLALICLALSATFSAFAEPEESPEELAAAAKRIAFFQQNFSKFEPVSFLKATNSDTIIQAHHVRTNIFKYEGTNYSGFRFTVPEWLDGDFEWIFCLDKTEAQRDFYATNFHWFIVSETGPSKGFTHFYSGKVALYPKVKARCPYTNGMFEQTLDQERLRPGRTHAIWFSFANDDMVDIAFAMTIGSQRGHREFGALPLN